MELTPMMLDAVDATEKVWPFKDFTTVTSGRTGIRLIARILRSDYIKSVLLPAYLCPSVIQPFREEGLSVLFYRTGSDLLIDSNDVERLEEAARPTAVFFINYFGFPVDERIKNFLLGIKERCWVIEDCVHGSLVEQDEPVVGQIGHFAITSFRKYLPLPDGGLVIGHGEQPLSSLPAANGRFVRNRLLGKFLRYELMQPGTSSPQLEDLYLDLFLKAETELDAETPISGMSEISQRLLGTIDLAEVMAQRRGNFAFLLKAFQDEPRLRCIGTPLLADLPAGVSPLVFPITVLQQRRDGLRQHLSDLRVFCPIHWHLPPEIEGDRFHEASQLSSEILGLPIDQRYTEEDMGSLVDRLLKAWDEIG